MDKCEFAGCSNKLPPGVWQPERGKKLCQQHSDEFEKLVKAEDAIGIMSFVIRSYGVEANDKSA